MLVLLTCLLLTPRPSAAMQAILPGPQVTIRLIDAAGAPVPVDLERPYDPHRVRYKIWRPLDVHGYSIRPVLPGEYVLEVRGPGIEPLARRVRLDPSDRNTLTLLARPVER